MRCGVKARTARVAALKLPAGGRIVSVARGSPAAQHGILPGDLLLGINGVAPRDEIDYRIAVADGVHDVELLRARQRLEFSTFLQPGTDLGVSFDAAVFDGVRQCNNHCGFCFLRGLPKGLRPSLYVRDDDYRLSFLFGTFVTLTNLTQQDWDRIAFQRLSPLYVSVHATDKAVRNRMIGNRHGPDILEQVDWLGRHGIQIHGQVVLCPGVNDRGLLEKTVEDLSARTDTVLSVAVVPVGMTKHMRSRTVRQVRPEEAANVIDRIKWWQRRLRARLGRGLVYASDELYMLAGRPIPPARYYDGFPQMENGVGLVRKLLSDWQALKRRVPLALARPRRVAWICASGLAPVLRSMAKAFDPVAGLSVEVVAVNNDFLGETITVSGLLAGQDVSRAIRTVSADFLILPAAMFGPEGKTLDGLSIEDLQRESSAVLIAASGAAELLQATLGNRSTEGVRCAG